MNFPVSPSDRDQSNFSSSEESFAASYQGSCLESSNSESTASPFRHAGDNQQERDESISSIASFSSSSGKEHSESNPDCFEKEKPPSAFDSVRMRAEALLKSGPTVVTKPAPNHQQSDSDVSHQSAQFHPDLENSDFSGSASRSGSFASSGSSEASPEVSQRSDASFAPSHHFSPSSHRESYVSRYREKDPTESSRQSGSYTNSGSYSSQSQTMEETQLSQHAVERGHQDDSRGGADASDLNSGSWNSGQSGSGGAAGDSRRREDRQTETRHSQHSHSNTSNQSIPFHSDKSLSQSSGSNSWRNASFSSGGASSLSHASPVMAQQSAHPITQSDQSHRRSPESFASSHHGREEKAPTESSHISGSCTDSDASFATTSLPGDQAQLVPAANQPIEHEHQSPQSNIDQSLSGSSASESRDGDPSNFSHGSSSEASFAHANQYSSGENSASSHPEQHPTDSSDSSGSCANSGSYSSASNAVEEAAASHGGHRAHMEDSNQGAEPHHIIASNLESKTWNSERPGSGEIHATPQVATDAAHQTQYAISNTSRSFTQQDHSENNSRSSGSEIWSNTKLTPGESLCREDDTSLTPQDNSVQIKSDHEVTSLSSLQGQDQTESTKQSGRHFSTDEAIESNSDHAESEGCVDDQLDSHGTVASETGSGSWNSERSISSGSNSSGVCPKDYSNLAHYVDNASTECSMAEPYSQSNPSPSLPAEQQNDANPFHSQSSYHQSSVESSSNCLSNQSQSSEALESSSDQSEETSYQSETQPNRSASLQYSQPPNRDDQHDAGDLSQNNESYPQSKSSNAVLSQSTDLSSRESVLNSQPCLPLPNATDPSYSQSPDTTFMQTTETAYPLSPVQAAPFRDAEVSSPNSTSRRSSDYTRSSQVSFTSQENLSSPNENQRLPQNQQAAGSTHRDYESQASAKHEHLNDVVQPSEISFDESSSSALSGDDVCLAANRTTGKKKSPQCTPHPQESGDLNDSPQSKTIPNGLGQTDKKKLASNPRPDTSVIEENSLVPPNNSHEIFPVETATSELWKVSERNRNNPNNSFELEKASGRDIFTTDDYTTLKQSFSQSLHASQTDMDRIMNSARNILDRQMSGLNFNSESSGSGQDSAVLHNSLEPDRSDHSNYESNPHHDESDEQSHRGIFESYGVYRDSDGDREICHGGTRMEASSSDEQPEYSPSRNRLGVTEFKSSGNPTPSMRSISCSDGPELESSSSSKPDHEQLINSQQISVGTDDSNTSNELDSPAHMEDWRTPISFENQEVSVVACQANNAQALVRTSNQVRAASNHGKVTTAKTETAGHHNGGYPNASGLYHNLLASPHVDFSFAVESSQGASESSGVSESDSPVVRYNDRPVKETLLENTNQHADQEQEVEEQTCDESGSIHSSGSSTGEVVNSSNSSILSRSTKTVSSDRFEEDARIQRETEGELDDYHVPIACQESTYSSSSARVDSSSQSSVHREVPSPSPPGSNPSSPRKHASAVDDAWLRSADEVMARLLVKSGKSPNMESEESNKKEERIDQLEDLSNSSVGSNRELLFPNTETAGHSVRTQGVTVIDSEWLRSVDEALAGIGIMAHSDTDRVPEPAYERRISASSRSSSDSNSKTAETNRARNNNSAVDEDWLRSADQVMTKMLSKFGADESPGPEESTTERMLVHDDNLINSHEKREALLSVRDDQVSWSSSRKRDEIHSPQRSSKFVDDDWLKSADRAMEALLNQVPGERHESRNLGAVESLHSSNQVETPSKQPTMVDEDWLRSADEAMARVFSKTNFIGKGGTSQQDNCHILDESSDTITDAVHTACKDQSALEIDEKLPRSADQAMVEALEKVNRDNPYKAEDGKPNAAHFSLDRDWMTAADTVLRNLHSEVENNSELEVTDGRKPHTSDDWLQSADASLERLRKKFNQTEESSNVRSSPVDPVAASQRPKQTRRGSQISQLDLARTADGFSTRRSSFQGISIPDYHGEDASQSSTQSQWFPDSPSTQEEPSYLESSSSAEGPTATDHVRESDPNNSATGEDKCTAPIRDKLTLDEDWMNAADAVLEKLQSRTQVDTEKVPSSPPGDDWFRSAEASLERVRNAFSQGHENQTNSPSSQQPKQSHRSSQVPHIELITNLGSTPRRSSFHGSNAKDPRGDDTSQSTTYNHLFPDSPSTQRGSIEAYSLSASASEEIGRQSDETPTKHDRLHSESDGECAEHKCANKIIDENWMHAADAALQKFRSKMEVPPAPELTSAQKPHTNDSWFQSADASLKQLRGRLDQDCYVDDKSRVMDDGYGDVLTGSGSSQQRGQSRRGSQISHIDLTRNPGISTTRRSSFHGSTMPEYVGEDTSQSTTYSHLFPDSPSKQDEFSNSSSSSEAIATRTSVDSQPSVDTEPSQLGVAEINPPLPRLRRRCSLGATAAGEAIQRAEPTSCFFPSNTTGSRVSDSSSEKSESSSVSKDSDDLDSRGVLNTGNDLMQGGVDENNADPVLNKVHQRLSQADSIPIDVSDASASSADDNYHDGENRRECPPAQEDTRKVVIDEDWLKKADMLLSSVEANRTTDPSNDQEEGSRISSIEYKDHLSQASNLTEDNLWDLDDVTSCVSESKHEDAEASASSSESGSSDELKSIMSGDQSLGIIEEDEEDTSRHSIPEVYLHQTHEVCRDAKASNQFENSSVSQFETRGKDEQQSEEAASPTKNKWKQWAVAQDDRIKDNDSNSGESDPESDYSDGSMGSTVNMKRRWATRGLVLLGIIALLILMLAMPWLVRGKDELKSTETDPPTVPFIPLPPQPTPLILETDPPTFALLPETASPSQALTSNTLTPTRDASQTNDLFKWELQATLEGERGSGFGSSVAAFNDVVVVGEPKRNAFSSFRADLVDNDWAEVSETAVQTLENNFGTGLSPIVKDRVVASTGGGNVFFFLYSQFLQSWQQVGGAMSGEAEEDFGVSCAVSDAFRVLVGAPKNSNMEKDAGIVYTFEYQRASNRDWTVLDQPVVGESAGDLFGSSIAMSTDGTLLHIGAPGALQGGYVKTFLWVDYTWKEVLELQADGPSQAFGSAVFALSHNAKVIAIGAPYHGLDRGVVRVYRVQPNLGTYDQLGPDIVGLSGDMLGSKGSLAGFLLGKTISIFVASKSGSIKRFDFNEERGYWDQNFESVTGLVSENTVIAGSSRNNVDYLVVGVPGLDKAMIYGTKSLSVKTKAPTLRPVPSPLNTPTKPPTLPTGRPTKLPLATLAPMSAPSQSQEPIVGVWKTVGGPYRIGQSGTRYGSAVALASTEMLSSAPLGIGVGVVLAFRKGSDGSNWGERPSQQLVGKQQGGEFGASVTLNDSFMLIGAPGTVGDDGATPFGAVFCYTKVGNEWTQLGSMLRGGQGVSGQYEDFGLTVGVSEDGRAVIGAPGSTTPGGTVGHGKVYIFEYIQERQAWTQTDSLIGKSTDEAFGSALDISGNGKYLIVGSPGYAAGFATIYQHNVFRWFPISTIDGGRAGDKMGQSVKFLAQDGSVVLAGSPGFESGRGRVVLHKLDAVTGRFLPFGPALIGDIGERFGESKKVGGFFSANMISVVVGTPTGLVRQFFLQGGTWAEVYNALDSGFRTRTGLLSLATYGWNNVVLGGDDMSTIYGLK